MNIRDAIHADDIHAGGRCTQKARREGECEQQREREKRKKLIVL